MSLCCGTSRKREREGADRQTKRQQRERDRQTGGGGGALLSLLPRELFCALQSLESNLKYCVFGTFFCLLKLLYQIDYT